MTTQADKDSMVSEFRHRKGKRVLPFSSGSTGGQLGVCERQRERESGDPLKMATLYS